jgi:chemotaxis protein MotA
MCLAIDGFDAKSVRCAIDMEIRGIEHDAETSASFYEAAAGYAPTLAMVGAAIGLMNVMKHISDIGEAAAGIGAAFVATVYGVLLANLVLLPIASKIRASCQTRVRTCHAIAEGVLAVADGVNPAVLRARLEALLQLGEAPGEKENSEAVAAIRQQPAAQKGAAS